MQQLTEPTAAILQPELGRMHFELEHRLPSEELARYVERHWIVSWELGEGRSFEQEILPHPCVNLASEPGRVAVWGIPLERSRHRIEGTGVAIGTKFRPGGLAGFVDRPVSRFNDRVLPLRAVFGPAGDHLEARLAELAGDPDAHIDAVERFLLDRLPEPDPRFELVSEVVDAMLTTSPETSVAEIADTHAVNPRTLQRLFRDYVGVTPKWVLKRYRMHVAAERIASGEAPDWAELALELGYFDQSHFIHDFNAQIGRTPGEYARACRAAAGRA